MSGTSSPTPTSSAQTPSAASTVPTVNPSSLHNAHHFITLKLSPTNYLYWKTQMWPFLVGQGLFGFIDGSKPCPPAPIQIGGVRGDVSAEFQQWVQQDNLLMSTLISSLSPEVISVVTNCTTSRDIWQTLERTYASPSTTRIMGLHIALQQLRQKPDEDVTTYLQRGKGFADELAAVGRPLSVSDLNIYILKGLKHYFKDLVTNVTARPELVSFDELHSLLLSHEFMHEDAFQNLSILSDSASTISPSPSANTLQRTTQTNNRGGFNNRGRGRNF